MRPGAAELEEIARGVATTGGESSERGRWGGERRRGEKDRGDSRGSETTRQEWKRGRAK